MQSYSSLYQDYSADNSFDYGRRSSDQGQNRTRRSTGMRRSNKVSAVGGMHRRRNKRWSW